METIRVNVYKDEDVVTLWQDTFADNESYIRYFLENMHEKKVLTLYRNDNLLAMLFLLECKYDGYDGAYVYAVATKKDERNKGYMGMLLNEAKKMDYDFLCLVPAEDYLFDVYGKFGFKPLLYSGNNSITQIDSDKSVLLDDNAYFNEKYVYFNNYDIPYISFVDSKYIYDENKMFCDGFFGKTADNAVFALRNGRVAEYLPHDDLVLQKCVGMIYSEKVMRKGYMGLCLD